MGRQLTSVATGILHGDQRKAFRKLRLLKS